MALNNGASSNVASIPVSGIFADGTQLQDPLSGVTYTVESGAVAVTLSPRSGVVLLPYPASVDLTPPTASAALSPAANSNGWNNSVPVTVNLSPTDSGGTGSYQLPYTLDHRPTTVTPR